MSYQHAALRGPGPEAAIKQQKLAFTTVEPSSAWPRLDFPLRPRKTPPAALQDTLKTA